VIVLVPAPLAESLSRALWDLARPAAIRVGDVTQQMFGWIEDLQSPRQRWLEVDTEFSIPVHAAAELGDIAGILAPYVGHGIEQADIDRLEQIVVANRGRWLVVYQAFPPIFKLKDESNPNGLGRTREQMIQENRLVNSTLP